MVTNIVFIYLLYSLNLTLIMIDFIAQNWGELLIGLMAFGKIVVNLTPTEKDNKVFGWIDDLINYFIKDKTNAS
jgi:hypothetical protein